MLFCSDPQALHQTYRRYLLGYFRERLPFSEVPIKLYLRRRGEMADGEKPAKAEKQESGEKG